MRRVLLSPVVMDSRGQVLRDGSEKSPSGRRSSGVVKNPGDSSEPLLITVFFTDEHTTVSDLAQTTVQMGAGTQAGWGAEKSCATTPTMRCALTGARKRAKQPGMAKDFCRLGVHRGRSVCS